MSACFVRVWQPYLFEQDELQAVHNIGIPSDVKYCYASNTQKVQHESIH